MGFTFLSFIFTIIYFVMLFAKNILITPLFTLMQWLSVTRIHFIIFWNKGTLNISSFYTQFNQFCILWVIQCLGRKESSNEICFLWLCFSTLECQRESDCNLHINISKYGARLQNFHHIYLCSSILYIYIIQSETLVLLQIF